MRFDRDGYTRKARSFTSGHGECDGVRAPACTMSVDDHPAGPGKRASAQGTATVASPGTEVHVIGFMFVGIVSVDSFTAQPQAPAPSAGR